MLKTYSARHRRMHISVVAVFALSIIASTILGIFSVAPVEAAAFQVERTQSAFAEGNAPTATLGSAPGEGNLLIVSAFSRSGSSTATHAISGAGWEKQVSLDTLLSDTSHRRALSVWTKTAGAAEPSSVTVSGDSGDVAMLLQEFSTPAPAEFAFLSGASNDNGDTDNATSLSSGTTAVNSGSQMWVSVLGVRNGGGVSIPSASWTAPISSTVHWDGGGNGRTLNSGYGLGVGDFAAESTASWSGKNTGASAAILVFSVPDMCYLPAQAGRTIVDMTPYEFIRSDQSQDAATHGPFAVDLPAGTYDVILHSWDDHSNKAASQPNESWYLQLWNADPVNFQNTRAIGDLPDDQNFITQVVDTALVIEEDVALVQAFHAAYGESNPNSIYPICVAFDKVEEEPEPEEEGEVLGTTDTTSSQQVAAPSGSVNAGQAATTTSVLAVLAVLASTAMAGYGALRLSKQS